MTLEELLQAETPAIILQRLLDAQTFCKDWHATIAKNRSLYSLQHYEEEAKEGEYRFADPTYTNVVDLAVSIMSSYDPEFRARGWSPSLQESERSSHIEKFLIGTIRSNDLRNESSVYADGALNFCRDGSAAVYTAWDPGLAEALKISVTLPDEESETGVRPMQGFKEPPLLVRNIDPMEMHLLPGGRNRWLHVFRVVEMTVLDVEQQYSVLIKKYAHLDDLTKSKTKGRFIDYWREAEYDEVMMLDGQPKWNDVLGAVEVNRQRCILNAVLFDGEFILPYRKMQGYEAFPYSVAFFKPVDYNKPQTWGDSVVTPLRSSLEALERSINRRTHQIDVFSTLPLVTMLEEGRPAIALDPGLNLNVIQLHPGEDVRIAGWTGNPPDVQQQIDFFRSRVQQSGFADLMFGVGSGQGAGYALAQLGDQSRLRLEQPHRRLEALWEQWAIKTLTLARNFGAGKVMRVYGRMRGRDFMDQIVDLDVADYLVTVRIKSRYPADDIRRGSLSQQARGILADQTIMERYWDVEQPDEERKKRLIDEALQHPVMKMYGMLSVLMDAANPDPENPGRKDEAAAMLVQMIQQGGIPGVGGPGRPAGPPPTGPLTGLQSQSGEPVPQAAGAPAPGQDFSSVMAQAFSAPTMPTAGV